VATSARDIETLRRMVGYIHQNGSTFNVTAFLLTGGPIGANATTVLDDFEFVFFTNEGRREAYEEFKSHGWGNPLADRSILGSS
jgi:hypothetical protein